MRLEDTAQPGSRISDVGDELSLVESMATVMHAKLARNRGKLHWREPQVTDEYLLMRLKEEMDEFLDAWWGGDRRESWDEAADVANFMAMLCDRKDNR